MLDKETVERVIEKNNLEPLKLSDAPRDTVAKVVRELKDRGFSNSAIGRELGIAESSVRIFLIGKRIGALGNPAK